MKRGSTLRELLGDQARPGAVLRPHVERDAHDCRVRINRIPVETDRLLPERAVPYKREVESAGLVVVSGMLVFHRIAALCFGEDGIHYGIESLY